MQQTRVIPVPPEHLLSIDPGISSGWALFSYGNLYACGVQDPREHLPIAPMIDLPFPTVVIEVPKIRPTTVNANDVLKLAVRVGEYKNYFERLRSPVKLFFPEEWKGQAPKAVQNNRTQKETSIFETAIINKAIQGVTAKGRTDLLDAVGIGKWYLRKGYMMPRPEWMITPARPR